MNKKFRSSTLLQIAMMLISIVISISFLLPIFRPKLDYSLEGPFFSSANLFNLWPEGGMSYLGLASRFLDSGRFGIFFMMIALLMLMPIALAVICYPRLRKLSYFGILPIIGMIFAHLYLGLGFTIEQAALDFTFLGIVYGALLSQLPILYILFVILSVIENMQIKKESKLMAPFVDILTSGSSSDTAKDTAETDRKYTTDVPQ
ncbi:hypothetical protein [Butyrivibrio sp. MC2013]|uniref:hypothetical protein n=1 Tax=Butyrivibrio sp. MC2013 TaxID=1280686 RepID=UPI000408DB38|nr:hypothetical protein [Butyrivibrio sp. MC2013]